MLKKFVHVIDCVSEISGKTFSFIVLPVALLEAVEVILRYVFNSPTDWTWELAAILAGGMFIMGAGWVLKEDRHVRTDIIYAKLPRKWQAIFDLFFFGTIFSSFLGVMLWKGFQQAIYSVSIQERTFSMWGPPLYPLKVVIAAACLILALQGIAKMIRDAHYLVKGSEL